MRNAIAVIGANFGDEGKGLATDFFSREYDADLVARCNGGSQAGHTVVDGDKRHVFGHVGSGAFAGKPTYLSSGFIVNPFILRKELKELKARQRIYAHPDCRVTTLYDMAINSLIEIKRGANRHGSCGMGINETVTRHAAGFYLDLKTIRGSRSEIEEKLRNIRNTWVPARLKELGITKEDFFQDEESTKHYFDLFENRVEQMAEELMYNGQLIQMVDPKIFLSGEKPIVIEGAQGLMLDEFLGDFPHVTRSVTGLASSIRAAAECGKTKIRPIYMTRSYLTRHGAGELLYEGAEITDKVLVDETNVDNDWQGSIRYAPLNLHELSWFIREDMKRAKYVGELFGVEVLEPKLFITCMDQLGEFVHVVSRNKELIKMKSVKLPAYIEKVCSMEVCATSHGPSASDVQLLHAVL